MGKTICVLFLCLSILSCSSRGKIDKAENELAQLSSSMKVLRLLRGSSFTSSNLKYSKYGKDSSLLKEFEHHLGFDVSTLTFDKQGYLLDPWGMRYQYVRGNGKRKSNQHILSEDLPQDSNKPKDKDIPSNQSDWNPSNQAHYDYFYSFGGADETQTDKWVYVTDAYYKKQQRIWDRNLTQHKSPQEILGSRKLFVGIFYAQIQFQRGNYIDQDQNGIGEYTFLAYLSGEVPHGIEGLGIEPNDLSLLYLPKELSYKQSPLRLFGYHFQVFLPDGKGGGFDRDSFDAASDKTTGIAEREKHYVAYAWPAKSRKTGAVYAVTEKGVIMTRNDKDKPAWNDLFAVKKGTADEVFNGGFDNRWSAVEK